MMMMKLSCTSHIFNVSTAIIFDFQRGYILIKSCLSENYALNYLLFFTVEYLFMAFPLSENKPVFQYLGQTLSSGIVGEGEGVNNFGRPKNIH